jgi:transglutaminase-like putative cysteine protease
MDNERDYFRAFLILCSAIALVLAAMVVPVLSVDSQNSTGNQMTPSPEPQSPSSNSSQSQGQNSSNVGENASGNPGSQSNPGEDGSGGGGAPGALSTSDTTTIGGNISAFKSLGQETHFVVESSQPSYWRTAAYAEYTGQGWATEESSQLRDTDDLLVPESDNTRVIQQYELRRSATSLPAVWRPSELTGTGEVVEVSPETTLESRQPLESGAEYSVISYAPDRSPAELDTAGTAYPTSIEQRYTQLPESTDPRVEQFTDELTAESGTPYQTATQIESWLETNKEYSLDANRTGTNDIASTFIFDMEQGYCEYFATSMLVMLRTQDIPARYVTGYSTGEPTGNGSYIVRGMNAHAWVEVYFPDKGWVRFDPTPGSARLASESEAFASGPNGSPGSTPGSDTGSAEGDDSSERSASEYNHSEMGSPGEAFSATGAPSTGQQSDAGSDGENGDSSGPGTPKSDDSQTDGPGESSSRSMADSDSSNPYTVTINRTEAIPGRPIEATVTQSEEPVSGVEVTFNQNPVGVTDENGTVMGTVPYTSKLNITVAAATQPTSGQLSLLHSDRYFSIRGPRHRSISGENDAQTESADGTSFPVETNGTIRTTERPFAGSSIVLDATVGGSPVSEAEVTVDGESVGRTDSGGQAIITLPNNTDEVEVRVSRGAVSGTQTVSVLQSINITHAGNLYPGNNITISATNQGQSVRNATVIIDNRSVGTTNQSGLASIQLPTRPGNVTITVRKGLASGSAELPLRQLTVNATATAIVPLPWTTTRIEADIGDRNSSGVDIRLNGQYVGTTDENGTLNATLPLANGATVVAVGYSQQATTNAGNPAGVLGAAIVALLGIFASTMVVLRRSETSVREETKSLLGLGLRFSYWIIGSIISLTAIVSKAVEVLLRLIRRISNDLTRLPALVRQMLYEVRSVGSRLVHRLWEGVTGLGELGRRIGALLIRPRALLSLLKEIFFAQGDSTDDGQTTKLDEPVPEDDPEYESRMTIREAWKEFLRMVSLRHWRTKTPGQIERRAINEDDLPPGPVQLITDAFRDVEYGDRSATDRVAGMREALNTIEDEELNEEGDE